MSAAPRAPGTGAPAGEKKGEVNELRALLRTVNTDKDSKRKQDVIKKVIAYMTLGIDVSRLFSDMVLASNTKDLVIKKMVYLYLCAYAQSNPELTLLAINTLQKDCRDDDPMVRGMALRSLTSLQLLSILEYVLAPLKVALTDTSGYVRCAGVMGVLKVYQLSPGTVKASADTTGTGASAGGGGEWVDTLYAMMRDRDPQVVITCINVLTEILADEGGIAINQAMIVYLLGRLKEFTDWGQCVVMDLTSKYTPASDDELFAIMNLLDGCLKVANSAVVLACTKCFLALTASLPDIQAQVFLRLKTPLLTMMASSSYELAYGVLEHVALIVQRAPGVFDDEYKQFYAKYNEPTYVKTVKLSILPKVANAVNAREVVAEMAEYVSGVDAELARQAIRATGEIGVRVPGAVEAVVEALLEAIEADAEYVRAQAVVTMQDILRGHPDRAHSVIPSLARALKRMETSPQGRGAVIWMLGEYGQLIADAPYQLEPLIDGLKDEPSDAVRCELLAATVKLFFKRPPEVQKMMGRLFKFTLNDPGVSANVRDRALLYYRLLRADVREASAVIGGDRPPIARYDEEQGEAVRAKIWSEFNSLSVLYGKPADAFIAADHLIVPLDAPGAAGAAAGGAAAGAAAAGSAAAAGGVGAATGAASDGDGLLSGGAGGEYSVGPAVAGVPAGGAAATAAAGAAAVAPAPAAVSSPFDDDLLGIGSGFGSMGVGAAAPAAAAFVPPSLPVPATPPSYGLPSVAAGVPSSTPSAAAAAMGGGLGFLAASPPAAAPAAPRLPVRPGAVLDPAAFQAKWAALPTATTATLRAGRVPATSEVEALARGAHIYTIASGDVGSALKFYFFAGDADAATAFHLLEVTLDKTNGLITAVIKSEAPAAVPAVAGVLAAALKPLPVA